MGGIYLDILIEHKMGKLTYALIFMFVIQFCLVIFLGADWPGSALYDLVINPTQWDDTTLVSKVLNDAMLIVGLGAVAVGSILFRNELLIYSGLAAVFLSYGTSLYQIYQVIGSQEMFGDFSYLMATLITGGLIIAFIMITLDYIRGKD